MHALKEIIAPHVDSFVTLAICQIKDDDAAVCTAIERVTQALETLLASRIPNLNGYYLTCACKLDFFLYEVGADGWLLRETRFLILIAFNYA